MRRRSKLLFLLPMLVISVLLVPFFSLVACSREKPEEKPIKVLEEEVVVEEATTKGKIVFDENYEIYVMNPDGSNIVKLTDKNGGEEPCFSPDETKIAFSSGRDGDDEINVMNSDGSDIVKLTDNEEWDGYPCFSPDGTKIAFSSDIDESYEIYIMNSDGSDIVKLTDSVGYDAEPCFSPEWN